MHFEKIDDCRARAKVHGGWLVETVLRTSMKTPLNIASCFVPDPVHEWVLEEKEVVGYVGDVTGD